MVSLQNEYATMRKSEINSLEELFIFLNNTHYIVEGWIMLTTTKHQTYFSRVDKNIKKHDTLFLWATFL